MGIGAVVMGVVVSFAIMTVFASETVPDSMGRVELFAETTSVREWESPGGTANG